ncbi:MAG TPA: DUF3892 domain-containing protein [Verrucomicrobiae bacterium]
MQWVDQAEIPAQFESHDRITHIGGVSGKLSWKHSQTQAIESIENNLFAYYLEKDALTMKLNVARTADGKKFLIANGGNEQPLLSLPAFPPANAQSV